MIQLNERLVFFLAQAMANRYFLPNKSGKVINIASMLSYQGGIRVPACGQQKVLLWVLQKALANEWASYGINVNAIAPGVYGDKQYGFNLEKGCRQK